MRAIILETVYEWGKRPYRKFLKRNSAWNILVTELLQYPNTSLGFHLACFLLKHSFEVQPKLENHDVYHVLTETGISVPEEISMQYYLLGNGKRSLYLFSVILLGTLVYPDQWRLFLGAYRRGRAALVFHQLDFSKLLQQPIAKIKNAFLIQ